jgi:rod shape-determining protein MreD
VVCLGSLLQVVLVPYLDLWLLAPALMVLCVVAATSGLKWSVALPIGFFGGVLVDALGAGLFGVGALSGVIAAAVSCWSGVDDKGNASRLRFAGVVAAAVAAHDLASVFALGLSGESWPPVIELLLLGVLPNAALNALLAYVVGGVLFRLVLTRERSWT